MLIEINIDALVGPTHHFGGLGVGNVASQEHAFGVSNPRAAALQGLRKAALVASLGVPQYLFLPPRRPRVDWLQRLGFAETDPDHQLTGDLTAMLQAALRVSPQIFSAAFSSAFMWAANAATITPAADALDAHTHITPANLSSSWHRALEPEERIDDLRSLFAHSLKTQIHLPLPNIFPLRDEGAANHMRLCSADGLQGVHVFVYGKSVYDSDSQSEETSVAGFLPRQTRAASQAVARLHALPAERVFFLQQHPQAIAAGVFHNDVIATSHQNLLLYHQHAFHDAGRELAEIEVAFQQATGTDLIRVEISNQELSLADAVRSYFFNSQIVTPTAGPAGQDSPRMVLICPTACSQITVAQKLIERLLADPHIPIDDVRFVDLHQSMAGGGGPACLRLRVPLTDDAVASLPANRRLGPALEQRMADAIERYYPEKLVLDDLCHAEFIRDLSEIPNKLALVADGISPDGR